MTQFILFLTGCILAVIFFGCAAILGCIIAHFDIQKIRNEIPIPEIKEINF